MRLPGFEPGLEAWDAPFEKKKEVLSSSIDDILRIFNEFCLVDLKLKQGSTYNHIKNIKRLLRMLDKPLSQINIQDLRTYLKGYLNKANGTMPIRLKL